LVKLYETLEYDPENDFSNPVGEIKQINYFEKGLQLINPFIRDSCNYNNMNENIIDEEIQVIKANRNTLNIFERFLNNSIKCNPDLEYTYYEKGLLMFGNDLKEALKCFKKCSDLNPQNYQYLLRKANCLDFLKQINRALFDYDKVIEMNPFNPSAYYAKGELLIEKKNFKEGLACFSKASDLDPASEFIQQYVSSKSGALFESNDNDLDDIFKHEMIFIKKSKKIISDMMSQIEKTQPMAPIAPPHVISYIFCFIKMTMIYSKNLSLYFATLILKLLFVSLYLIYTLVKRITKSNYIFFYAVLFIIISVTFLME